MGILKTVALGLLACPALGQATPEYTPAGTHSADAPRARNRPLVWNLGRQVLPLFNALDAGEHGELAIIGDSISFRENSYNWFLKALFEADYGSGGEGFLSPSGMYSLCDETMYVRCGIDLDHSQGADTSTNSGARHPRSYGLDVDGNYGTLAFYNGVHGHIRATIFGDTLIVHYVKEEGGGSFRVYVDEAPVIDVDATTEGEPQHAQVVVDLSPATPASSSAIKLKHLDGGQVFIDGFEMIAETPGFVYHRLARGGAGPTDFLLGLGEPTRQFLQGLDPQVAILMLDWGSGSQADTFVQDTNDLLDFCEAAMPNTRFVLMTHHAFQPGIAGEANWYFQIAGQRGHGYINLFDLHSGIGELNALGFMEDHVHLSPEGGAWFADYIYGLMTGAARVAMLADHNDDGSLDARDAVAFLGDFAGQRGRADVNADGRIDAGDVVDFLDAFARSAR